MKKPIKKPAPVTIVDTPVPVELVGKKQEKRLVDQKKGGKALAPNTTEQDDLVTAGQRRINLIWELTQALVAVSITWSIIYMRIKGLESDGTLTNAFFLIVSMYFIRTNHKLIGGVPNQKYEGR